MARTQERSESKASKKLQFLSCERRFFGMSYQFCSALDRLLFQVSSSCDPAVLRWIAAQVRRLQKRVAFLEAQKRLGG